MRSFYLLPLAIVGLVSAAPATSSKRDTLPTVQYLTSNNVDGSVSLVENSGVCETTPGVNQYSGYINTANDTQHFFFWFFEARHNAEKAPFVVWLNGGPGCSSLIGLFQEHGPCHVRDDNTTYLNPYSWNNYSNIVYIDQPIGTGFSYGDDTVNSTVTAASPFWHAWQVLFENGHFSKYESREIGLWTESYGGHYGPEFVTYFEEQNEKIDKGEIQAEKLDISVLGINNGWYDPIIQNEAYMKFARYNPVKQIINDTVYQQGMQDYWMPGGCYEQEQACYSTGNDTVCQNADNFCFNTQFAPAIGDLDSYDILDYENTTFPSENYLGILANPAIMAKIGAKSTFSECADAPYEGFYNTGDDARTQLPHLQAILNAGKVRTLIWAGDLDFNCNWMGSVRCLEQAGWKGSSEFKEQSYRDVHYPNNGSTYGTAKSIGNMTWLIVNGAGHEVPAYRPAAAYDAFVKTMKGEKLD